MRNFKLQLRKLEGFYPEKNIVTLLKTNISSFKDINEKNSFQEKMIYDLSINGFLIEKNNKPSPVGPVFEILEYSEELDYGFEFDLKYNFIIELNSEDYDIFKEEFDLFLNAIAIENKKYFLKNKKQNENNLIITF